MTIESIMQGSIQLKKTEIIDISDNLEILISRGNNQLKQVRKLRLNGLPEYMENKEVKNKKNNAKLKKQIEKIEQLIIDDYDRYADHLIISTLKPPRVIAYVRIIDAYTAFNLGGYFCENNFNINNIYTNNSKLIELSRIVIDPEYQNSMTIKALWSGVLKYANKKNVNTIMGTFPVSLKDNFNHVEKQVKQLKSSYLSSNIWRVEPYQLLPQKVASSKQQKYDSSMTGYFFELGPKLCGEAHWNCDLNQAELFFYYQLSANQQNQLNIENTDDQSDCIVA
jgi:putative hemolysin